MKDSDSFLEVSSSIDIVKIIEVGLVLDWVIVVNIKWWRLFFCFLCCRIVAICCLDFMLDCFCVDIEMIVNMEKMVKI